VKVTVNGQTFWKLLRKWPVAVLDAALRKALVNFYPQIAEFELTDYKVRILDGYSSTMRKPCSGRMRNGHQRWTASQPTFWKASYQAVVEGLEYGLCYIPQYSGSECL